MDDQLPVPIVVPQVVRDLVARFGEHATEYKRSDYNETALRRDFLDAFFGAQGWDEDNRQGYSEAYREVVHEDRAIDRLVYGRYGLTEAEVAVLRWAGGYNGQRFVGRPVCAGRPDD